MSINRKGQGLFKSIAKSYIGGCGGCGKPKLSEVVQPTPIPKTLIITHENPNTSNDTCCHYSSSLISNDDKKFGTLEEKEDEEGDLFTSTTTLSQTLDTQSSSTHCCSGPENDPRNSRIMASPFSKIGNSIAVVKESDDPYKDFRNSMHQMVLEKGIYGKDGLEELLHCFLQLNSPCYHDVIIKAFTEIWHGVISEKIIPNPRKLEIKLGSTKKVAIN